MGRRTESEIRDSQQCLNNEREHEYLCLSKGMYEEALLVHIKAN